MSGIDHQVAALVGLDLDQLREAWRIRYGRPPRLRSPDLLRLWLAWRIQSDALGGLSRESRRRLSGQSAAAPRLPPGTRLVRDWRGRTLEVVADREGFSFEGKSYRTLSQIAREVTGVQWNGPRFFGLREDR
ncbi:hypothetical protein BH09PSE2_BH09PSE2_09690 [soil metagenome]